MATKKERPLEIPTDLMWQARSRDYTHVYITTQLVPFSQKVFNCAKTYSVKQKHTTEEIRCSSPTQLLMNLPLTVRRIRYRRADISCAMGVVLPECIFFMYLRIGLV